MYDVEEKKEGEGEKDDKTFTYKKYVGVRNG